MSKELICVREKELGEEEEHRTTPFEHIQGKKIGLPGVTNFGTNKKLLRTNGLSWRGVSEINFLKYFSEGSIFRINVKIAL